MSITVNEAIDLMRDAVTFKGETECVSIWEVCGRVLAEDVTAEFDQPPFDRSAMDGYACRHEDIIQASREHPVRLKVIAEVDAGGWLNREVKPGEAVRIMTGAPVPAGCDCCIRQEDTDYGEAEVEIYQNLQPFSNIALCGDDFQKGTTLLRKGTLMRSVEAGILAGMGRVSVNVYKKVSVSIISTGDEVTEPGQPLQPGKIYNMNQTFTALRLKELGAELVHVETVVDDPVALAERLKTVSADSDLIITTGGVSVGKKDILHEATALCGAKRLFWKILMKPGMPTLCSQLNGKLILSLSGNPFGSFACTELLAIPILAYLGGMTQFLQVMIPARIESAFVHKGRVTRYLRGSYQNGVVTLPGESQSNGTISTLAGCNCLVELPEGVKRLEPGDLVNVLLWNQYLTQQVLPKKEKSASKPLAVGICGVKNSGKTTLIGKLIRALKEHDCKVAVIKHDGHSFQAEVPGTDSWKHLNSGADCVIVGDQEKYMKTEIRAWNLEHLIRECQAADIILIEGMKHGTHPKFEIIREGISTENCSDGASLMGVLSDFRPELTVNVPVYELNDIDEIVRQILQLKNRKDRNHAS